MVENATDAVHFVHCILRLLKNCFWGNGPRYAFWGSDRPSIENRLFTAQDIQNNEKIQRYYQTELQEFMNYMNMPKLEIVLMIEKEGWYFFRRVLSYHYKYKFTLPNFEQGVSELRYGLVGTAGDLGHMDYNPVLEKAMSSAIIRHEQGTAMIEVSMQPLSEVTLYWYYEPQPEVVVPMRRLNDEGEIVKEIFGMKNESPL